MADIPEYNAPALDIRPSEIGVESTAAAGRRLGAYGQQIAASKEQVGREVAGTVKSVGDQALAVAEHMEIAQGARHGAGLMASATQGLNAYMSGADIPDGPDKQNALDERLNNPKAAQQWIDSKLNPSLEQFQSGFITEGGQQYAQRFTANLRDHMVTAAMADQSTAAGIAMKDNLQKTADGYATAAFNSHNLHDVTGYINAFDHAVGAIATTSPTINADGQARIKEWAEQEKAKIITTAVQGRISAGGSYADITKAYPQYVQPGQNYQFEKMAQFYAKGQENAQKQQILLDHAIAEDNAHKFMNDAYSKYVHTDETGKTTIDPQYAIQVGKIPTMFRNAPNAVLEAERQQSWITREQKPETDARISHGTYTGLLRDMRSVDISDPGKEKELMDRAWEARLRDPGKADSMTEQDFTSFRNELAARKTPEGEALAKDRDLFFKRFGLQFDPGMGVDPKTAGNSYLAEMAARQREADVQRKGDDPRSVYNPNSPNFFGTAANIQKYKIPLQDQLKTLPSAAPAVGAINRGYRFLGGDPSKPESWAKVQ